MIGLLTFAFMAGAVATANPCGFALLPAYLARRLGTDRDDARSATSAATRALAVGAVTTFGFLVMYGVVGGVLSFGVMWLGQALPWVGLLVGVALAIAGIVVLMGGQVAMRLPALRTSGAPGGLRGDLLFGIGYGAASLSCTFPVFLAVTGASATGGLVTSVLGFVAYALGMGTILTALAVAAALLRNGLAAAITGFLPYVRRASGALLFIAGIYVTYYWADALLSSNLPREGSIIFAGERLSGAIRSWLGGPAGRTTVYASLVLLAGFSSWTLLRRVKATRSRGPGTQKAPPAGQPAD